MMELREVTYQGPAVDDQEMLGRLSIPHAAMLGQLNGYIQYHGGFHLRGACRQPDWHSLRSAWVGDDAFHQLYPGVVLPEDVPFAEDCLGDQFLLREGDVVRLSAETGELESLEMSFGHFLREIHADPVEFLGMHPLLQFQEESGQLEPGQLLSAYPPFCTEQSAEGVDLKAVPGLDRRRWLADFAAQIRALPDGASAELRVEDKD
jgi:hypothetical protein